MPDQQAAPEADRLEQARQCLPRLVMHVAQGPRQRDRARLAVAGARIDEHAGAGRRRELVGKIAPHSDAAETLVQQHERRRLVGARPDHAVFQTLAGKFQKSLIG